MKKKFLDYLDPSRFKEKSENDLALSLGIKLSSGVDLPTALKYVVNETENKYEKEALINASDYIIAGQTPKYALKSRLIKLRPRDKYLLSLDMNDVEKGNILKSLTINVMNREKCYLPSRLFTVIFIFIGVFAAIFCLFVVPQLHEMARGAYLQQSSGYLGGLGNTLYFVEKNKLYIIYPFVIMALSFFIITIGKLLFNTEKKIEEADFMSIIAASSFENQWLNIRLFANKICFPEYHDEFKLIADSAKSGKDIEQTLEKSRFSSIMNWLLLLSIHNKADREFLADGANLMQEEAIFVNNQKIRFIEICLVILETFIVSSIAYYMVGMLEIMKIGALG